MESQQAREDQNHVSTVSKLTGIEDRKWFRNGQGTIHQRRYKTRSRSWKTVLISDFIINLEIKKIQVKTANNDHLHL